jgi:type II secretory pathway pseudopilin PulG
MRPLPVPECELESAAPVAADQSPARRPGEAGFTLVAMMVMLAILSIMMGVVVQTVTAQMKREKEAELIFRGNQYVEAIRLYRVKYGRFPMSLKEIWKAKPRVIRKKWKDPMTDSWNWGIIYLDTGTKVQIPGTTPTPTPEPTPTPSVGTGFGQPPSARLGPIIGVHTTKHEKGFKVYEGHRDYFKWNFEYKPPKVQKKPVPPPPIK